MSKFLESKKVRITLWTVGGFIVLLFVFGLGILVGYHNAIFSSRFGQDYYRNFYGAPSTGPLGQFMGPAPVNPHGTVGTVIDVGTSNISVKDPQNNEQSIEISPDTVIREVNQTIPVSVIKIGDQVTVIGEPNDQGQITARFIRVFTATSSMPEGQ